ncbi:hypothetical protein ORI89_04585 [Sphingobacterium sp. UT-1RO-CII-1]|uniref:hypothetical protein n=1 Tax=Sphingobacterium sp. UT-1RO-CII-1 TaxID=2995225 RepID=UPI00227C45F7|nr:hypothetical protein [Sphingobacterium sp. UT-1RO-CII-1]MCY4778915.1 hypothetical protein [Sphingobacterium sp. UT-1RO-CII-1]
MVVTTAVTCRTFLDTCWPFRSDSAAFLVAAAYHRYAEMQGLSVSGGSDGVAQNTKGKKASFAVIQTAS